LKQQKAGNPREVTYAGAGVDRKARERLRKKLSSSMTGLSRTYPYGSSMSLPFGLIFPQNDRAESFLDFQIEGVGSKTLIAELAKRYDTIGMDAVAMAVNDVIRSGAKPVLLSDALHIARSDARVVRSILRGVIKGASASGCVLASGETGDVSEILHQPLLSASPPFDLFVSTLGIVDKDQIVRGEIGPGDIVIGLESSGIHSNGLSLARRLLIKQWGGLYELDNSPPELRKEKISTVGEELLRPTRIYVKPFQEAHKRSPIKAAIHITGDGFAKFRRILEFQPKKRTKLAFEFDSLGEAPPVFSLIESAAKLTGRSLSMEEMFRTFNMGYGFAVIVSRDEEQEVLDSFNRYCSGKTIGRVTSTHSKIALKGATRDGKTILF